MKIIEYNKNLSFDESHVKAETLFANKKNRLLRFCLLPGQEIKEHKAPSSPVIIKIIKGKGLFWGEDRVKKEINSDSMIVFNQNEIHGIKALNEELVFIAYLHGIN